MNQDMNQNELINSYLLSFSLQEDISYHRQPLEARANNLVKKKIAKYNLLVTK